MISVSLMGSSEHNMNLTVSGYNRREIESYNEYDQVQLDDYGGIMDEA